MSKGHYDWETVEKIKPEKQDPCNPQHSLFIRADSLDNYLYGTTPTAKAKGASISYLNDQVSGVQTIGINGMVSYVALRSLCPGNAAGRCSFYFGICSCAVHSRVKKPDDSTIKKRTEHQGKWVLKPKVEVSRGFSATTGVHIRAVPLFRISAAKRVPKGLNLYWDAFDADLHLGGYINANPYLRWFVQLRARLISVEVNAVGVTNLDLGALRMAGRNFLSELLSVSFRDMNGTRCCATGCLSSAKQVDCRMQVPARTSTNMSIPRKLQYFGTGQLIV